MRGSSVAIHTPSNGRAEGHHDFTAFCVREKVSAGELPPSLSYPGGVALYRQGEEPEEVFYIEHGLVKLLRLHPEGAEVIIGLRSAGWFLAAAAAVLEQPHAVTAVTVTPCRVSRLRAPAFRHLVRTNAGMAWSVLRMYSEEVLHQIEGIADSTCLSARERLRKLLARLGPGAARPAVEGMRELEMPLRQWELAGLVGVTPQYLCQLLHETERDA